MRKLKTIKSRSGLASFIATLQTKANGLPYVAGYMPFHLLPVAPRYSSTPAWAFYRIEAKGLPCVTYIETAHKTYEIWEVESQDEFDSLLSFEEAEKAYLNRAA